MELDVTKKVRTAIKAKLLELGVHVDDELPDYIMILIANRRTKIQMEDDLGLFLGDNTLKFSNWLHQVLKKLEEVTTGGVAAAEKPGPSSSSANGSAATPSKAPPARKSSDVTSSTSSISKEKEGTEKKQPTHAQLASGSTAKVKDSKATQLSTSSMKRKSDVSKEESDAEESQSRSPSSKKLRISRKKIEIQSAGPVQDKTPLIPAIAVVSSSKRSPIRERSRSISPSKSLTPPLPSSLHDNLKSRVRSRSPVKFNRLESSVVVTKKPDKLPSKVASVLSRKPLELIKRRSRSPVTGPRRSPVRTAAPSRRSDRDRERDRSFSPPNNSSSSVVQRRRFGDVECPSRSTQRGSLISRIRRNRTPSRSRSRSGSPTSKARKSLRSLVAVVKRHNDLNAAKDEEYNPLRPEVGSSSSVDAGESSSGGVASVVHVTPRPKRATKQEERGSNKLLFRALADAQKSIVSHSMGSNKAVSSSVTSDSKDKDTNLSDKPDSRKDKGSHFSSPNTHNQQQQRESLSRTRSRQEQNFEGARDRDLESRRLRKTDGSSKPSVKDRLGFRLGKKVDSSHDDKVSSSYRDYSDNEDDDLHSEDFMPGSEDYKTIKISVPTSKTAKERNVTLEYAEEEANGGSKRVPVTSSSKPASVSYDEPKRLSIQVNVDSDTSSSEDELEIQPRTTEDLNLERLSDRDDQGATSQIDKLPKAKVKLSIEDKLKGRLERKPKKSNDSSSDEPKRSTTKSNTATESKSKAVAQKAESSASDSEEEPTAPKQEKRKQIEPRNRKLQESPKQVEPEEDVDDSGSEASEDKPDYRRNADADTGNDTVEADGEDDHEEIEIEEYEEIEEEEDDDEYEVVIQERNIALPDPDEYDDKKSSAETMDMGDTSVGGGGDQMDLIDETGSERKSVESMFGVSSPHQTESIHMAEDTDGMVMVSSGGARYPLRLRTDNSSAYDTKFVVTMEGAEDMNEEMTYYEEESMETEPEETGYSPGMDLRHRITRSFAQSQSLESIINAKNVRQGPLGVGSFRHNQGGTGGRGPTYDSSRKNVSSRSYLPITGGPVRPALPVQKHSQSTLVPSTPLVPGNKGSAPGSSGPACKYWPDCSFKDKCIYPHPTCKFGDKCTKLDCPYKHEGFQSEGASSTGKVGGGGSNGVGSVGGGIENDGKVICKFFPKCHSMSCQFYHPSPCRFGVGCTDVKCKNYHPGVTVAEQRCKNKLFGSVTRSSSNYNRALPPAAHLLRWKAPSATSGEATGTNSKGTTPPTLETAEATTSDLQLVTSSPVPVSTSGTA